MENISIPSMPARGGGRSGAARVFLHLGAEAGHCDCVLVSRAECGLVFSIAGLRDWLARGAFWFAGAGCEVEGSGASPERF